MDLHFAELAAIVAPIYCVMAAGFGMRKAGVLTAEADRSLLRVVVTLLIPALAFDSILGNEAFRHPENLVLPPLLAFLTVALGIVVARLVAAAFRIPGDVRRRTFVFVTSVHNYFYIPLPLCQALLGREAVGVLFAYWMGAELALWSIALWQLIGHPDRRGWWRALNVPIVAIPAAIAGNALGVGEWLPGAVRNTLHLLGVCGLPMGLLLSGALLADHANRAMLRHGARVGLASLTARLVVLPALLLVAAKFLPFAPLLKAILVVEAAMPAAIMPIGITRLHGGDPAAALQIVLGTSLVSLVTVPFVIALGLRWVT